MTKYVIRGGKPLHGQVEISGAKNAAVAILPAALLVDGVCRIENVPSISDVSLILGIMEKAMLVSWLVFELVRLS